MKVYDGSATETVPEPEPERIKVGIAEHRVATGDVMLSTSGLGSCVGVALHDRETATGGLVHVMLPISEDLGEDNAAKFADTGTHLLLEEVVGLGANPATIEAKLAGGSDMLDFTEGGSGIGERNVATVREVLAANDVPIVAEDVGGDYGRSVRLDAATGEYVVKSARSGERTL